MDSKVFFFLFLDQTDTNLVKTGHCMDIGSLLLKG